MRIVRLGRLLRDHPILRAAVAAIVAEDARDEGVFAARQAQISTRTDAWLRRLRLTLGPLLESTKVGIAISFMVAVRHSTPSALSEILEHQKSSTIPLAFSVAEITSLHTAFVKPLAVNLKNFASSDGAVEAVATLCNEFHEIIEEAGEVAEIESFLKSLNSGRVADRLIDYARRWDARLQGARAAEESLVPDGIEQDVPTLIDRLLGQLESGVSRRYALYRLRAFFETFERSDLRERLAGTGRSKEAVLQHAMDAFLFHDGFFPLTHVGASTGYLDTVLVGCAEESGIPPLLIELKQVVGGLRKQSKVTRAQVVQAIEAAKAEVEAYRGFIASRTQWAGIEPMTVVVHTCPEDLKDLEADDVLLIDLGDRRPSKKKPRRSSKSDQHQLGR